MSREYPRSYCRYLKLFVNGGSHGWRFDYRHDGRRNTLSLGTNPGTTLSDAHKRADDARRLIKSGRDPSDVRAWVFPWARTNGEPMSENTVNAALRRLGYERATLTAHGFRGMAPTMLHESGWPTDVIERQLSHCERNSVKAACNHAEHLPARRQMMQAWADYLDSLRACSKVVPLRAA